MRFSHFCKAYRNQTFGDAKDVNYCGRFSHIKFVMKSGEIFKLTNGNRLHFFNDRGNSVKYQEILNSSLSLSKVDDKLALFRFETDKSHTFFCIEDVSSVSFLDEVL